MKKDEKVRKLTWYPFLALFFFFLKRWDRLENNYCATVVLLRKTIAINDLPKANKGFAFFCLKKKV